jgi:4-hydroxybenzoate polyprenyltransferase
LLLGISAVPALLGDWWFLALVPVAYIAAITAVSRGEVHGGRRATGTLALVLLGAVICGLLLLATRSARFEIIAALPFLAIFIGRVIPPFWTAYRNPEPLEIRNAVKTGVLSLIVLDATIAAGFAGILYGLIVLSLLFVAARIARLFAVT